MLEPALAPGSFCLHHLNVCQRGAAAREAHSHLSPAPVGGHWAVPETGTQTLRHVLDHLPCEKSSYHLEQIPIGTNPKTADKTNFNFYV